MVTNTIYFSKRYQQKSKGNPKDRGLLQSYWIDELDEY